MKLVNNRISFCHMTLKLRPSLAANIDELVQSFMYSQLFKEIILDIEHNDKAKQEFVDFIRFRFGYSNVQLDKIHVFERDYKLHSPIWWYTKDVFIYSILNEALRTQNIEVIMKMGFFIHDLHHQIEQVHKAAHQTTQMTLFRGQRMCHLEFENLKKHQGGLLSFNNFLSTTSDYAVSETFVDGVQQSPDFIGIIFIMDIDPKLSSTPFCYLNSLSNYSDGEQEILFAMHAVFRIGKIEQIIDRYWHIYLTLTKDNDKQLNILTEFIRRELGNGTGWQRLGKLMIKIGHFDKADKVYTTLLEAVSDDNQEEQITSLMVNHNNVAEIKRLTGNYSSAMLYYKKSA
jgi:tetratricopeptide (TPR) repeat protein